MKILQKRREEIWIYSVVCGVIAAAIILFLRISGKTFIHTGDGFDQYYPAFLYTGRYLRNILSGTGRIRLYDFSIGLGEDIIGALNYYGFGDPLNLLAVFATQKTSTLVYGICVLIRIYLAGLGMILFLKEHGYEGHLVSGGGILYAFSLYVLRQGLTYYTWIDMVYLLPFLLLETERLVKKEENGKDTGEFAFLVGISACSGFYYLYMLTVWIFLYACYRYWALYHNKFELSHLLKKISKVFVSYCLGIMAGGIVLFPALDAFFHSSRGIGSAEKWSFFPKAAVLLENFSNLIIPMTNNIHPGLAVSFCSVVGLAGVWFLKRRERKVVFCFLLLAYFSPVFGRFMNGFGYATDRWIYTVHFAVVYITVAVLKEYLDGTLPKPAIVTAAGVALFSLGVHYLINGDKIRSAVYLCICVIMTVGLLKRKFSANGLFLAMIGGVFLNVFFLFVTWHVGGHYLVRDFCSAEEIRELTAIMDDNMDADAEERVDIAGISSSDSLIDGKIRAAEHLSVLNENTYHIWREFMVSPGIGHATHVLRGLNGRLPLEILLGMDQYQTSQGVKDNPYALPLGVQYANSISYEAFNGMSALTRQKAVLDNIVLEKTEPEEDLKEYQNAEVEIPCKIELSGIETEGNLWKVDPDSTVILTLDHDPADTEDGELYVLFSDLRCLEKDFITLHVGSSTLYVQSRETNYYTGLKDYLIHVSGGIENNRIVITFQEECELKLEDIKTYWYSYEGMVQSVNKLKEHSMINTVVSNDRVTGEIRATDGYLFFRIPYHHNWKVYVDGEKKEVLKANAGFMAVYLQNGEHQIEWRYEPLWFNIGKFSSLIGILVVIRRSIRYAGNR